MNPLQQTTPADRPVVEISGIVVHAVPGHGAALTAALREMPGVTVHAVSPEGKLVVTLETAGPGESVALYERIGRMDGVSAVAMAYHRIETDPDEEA